MAIVKSAALTVAIGDMIGLYVVRDISYSQDQRRIYFHMTYQRTPRSKMETVVHNYTPLEIVTYRHIPGGTPNG
jgi:hypothetical protein